MNLTLIVLIVCPALCVFSFIYIKWYIKNRTSASGVLKETRIEVKKWINEVNLSIADINAVTDRNLMLIENKIKELNELLEDTDKRISVYIKEVEKSRTSETLYTQLGRGVRAAINTPSLEMQPVQQALPLNEESTPKKTAAKKEQPLSKKQIRLSIDQLINEGLAPPEIAKKLNISIAEVDLAMQLRRNFV